MSTELPDPWDERPFPRENLRPLPGAEDERWHEADNYDRFRQHASETAYGYGKRGGKRKRLLGDKGRLASAILWDLDMRIALARQEADAKKADLIATAATLRARVKKCEEQAKAYDRRAAATGADADEVKRSVAANRSREARLSRGQRGGRGIKVEAGFAVSATGVADAGAFILTLNAVGGALWVRWLVALGVVSALNIAIIAGGRLLDGFWGLMQNAPQALRAAMVGGTAVTLFGTVAMALLSAGNYRRDAVINLDRGFPTDPEFLIWTGLAAALGSMIALAFLHHAAEGNRLLKERVALEAQLAGLQAQQRELVENAGKVRDAALDALAEAQRALAKLGSLSSELSNREDEIRARSNKLLALAAVSFDEGRLEWRSRKMDPSPTFDEALDTWLERQIDGLTDITRNAGGKGR